MSVLALQMAVPSSLWANPTGEVVSHGSASFERSGNELIIRQGSDKLITKWGSFSIGKGERTQFIQPNGNSAALNRVVGGSRSILDGEFSANGKVILINPAGVTVGPTGVVNVNSFTASTQDLADEAFIGGGDLLYKGTSQETVENHGMIRASGGDAILIAKHVKNNGSLEAPKGVAALVGGTEVRVKPSGEERLFIKPTSEKGASVTQSVSGRIAAAAAEIKAAGNPYATAINLDGLVQSPKIKVAGGGGDTRIAGTLKSQKSDASGGDVAISGQRVLLTSTAIVDASGTTGGAIQIGGGFQGKDATIQNAQQTVVSAGAQILANATQSGGAGGTVILWSDDTTAFCGNISAQGLGTGAGGFVEVSGKTNLVFEGTVNLASELGPLGTLLLDPTNIEVISGASATTLTQVDQFADVNLGTITGGLPGSQIRNTTLNAATANVVLQATNNIIVNAAINIAAAGVGLSLLAGNDINLNAAITTNNGSLSFIAGNDPAAATGNVTTSAAALLTTGAGGVANIEILGNHVTLNRGITMGNGNLTVTARTGDIQMAGASPISHGSGVIRLEAARDVVLKGTAAITQQVGTIGGSTTLIAQNRDVIIDGANAAVVRQNGTINLTAGHDLLVYTQVNGGVSNINVTTGNDFVLGNGTANYYVDSAAGSVDTALTGVRANSSAVRNARVIAGGLVEVNVGSDLFVLSALSGGGYGTQTGMAILGCNGPSLGLNVDAKTLTLIAGVNIAAVGYATHVTGSIGNIPAGSDINVNLTGGTGTGLAGKSLVVRGGSTSASAILGAGGEIVWGTVQSSLNVNVNGGALIQGGLGDSAYGFVGNTGVSAGAVSAQAINSDGSLGGEINFAATGDVDLIAGAGPFSRAHIGTIGNLGNQTMDVNVQVGGNLTLQSLLNDRSSASIGATTPEQIDADIYVTVGGNLTLESTAGYVGIGNSDLLIATTTQTGNTHVLVGNDLALSATGPSADVYLRGSDLTNVAAGGNVTLTADQNGLAAIGSLQNGSATVIQSAGDIRATSTTGGDAILGGNRTIGHVVSAEQSTTLRAAGDIQISRSIEATGNHAILIEAGTTLAPGALWGANATTLNGQSLAGFTFSGGNFSGTPLAIASPAAGTDGLGAFWIDTATGNGVILATENGDLTLLSKAFRQDGSTQTLVIDDSTTTNAAQIDSINGNLTIAGFRDIEGQNVIHTNGNVLLAAWRDLNLQAAGGVSAGGKVTLVADEQAGASAGDGWFRNLGTVTSGTNEIAIYAVYGPQNVTGVAAYPSQVILGNLAPAANHAPGGSLNGKFSTSYQGGGASHGAGYANYAAGNGSFGAGPVIWYKLPAELPVVPPVVLPTVPRISSSLRTFIQSRLPVPVTVFLDPKEQFDNELKEDGRRDERYQNKRFAMNVDKEKYAAALQSWGVDAGQVSKLSKVNDREYFIERKSFLADAFAKRYQSEAIEK